MHLLVPRSRSSAKVKVKFKGYISQKMAVSGAFVFHKHILLFQVTLTEEVEIWVAKLHESVGKTIREMNISVIQECINNVPIEEWAAKVSTVTAVTTY